MESLLFQPHPYKKKSCKVLKGKKNQANAYFKKKFMENEWVGKKIMPTTNHPTHPTPTLRSKMDVP